MIQKQFELQKIKVKINEQQKIIARLKRLNVPNELLKPRMIELSKLKNSLN